MQLNHPNPARSLLRRLLPAALALLALCGTANAWWDGDWSIRKKIAVDTIDTEAKRAKLAELAIHLQRMVDDQKRRNDEMYKIGMELLDRYEKFGLGQALVAREPFVGLTRAKFETLVQDYEDKLTDQRITEQSTPGQKPKQ